MLRVRHWILKAAVQKTLSLLPGAYVGNSFFRRCVTKSLRLSDTEFGESLVQCRKHLENYFAAAGNSQPAFSVFELGTGPYPVIPVGMYLCGASKVTTVDIQPLLSPERVRLTLRFYCEHAERGNLPKALPWVDPTRVRCLLELARAADSSMDETLAAMGIRAVVEDVTRMELAPSSIDFFFSNTTLQHIPKDTLVAILVEFRQLATPRAVMSHHIYMGDDFARFDPFITEYNFLRFSRQTWELIDNSLHYHNRLRISDYRAILESTGWTLDAEDTAYGLTQDIRKVPLARDFRHYCERDLLAVRTWIVSRCSSGP